MGDGVCEHAGRGANAQISTAAQATRQKVNRTVCFAWPSFALVSRTHAPFFGARVLRRLDTLRDTSGA
jgi:hypothetical protein